MADKSQRTEQPTPHRIDKARREGQFASSKELLGALQFLAFVFLLARFGPAWLERTLRSTQVLFGKAFRSGLGTSELAGLCRQALAESLVPLLVVGAALVGLSLCSQLAMTRMGFSFKKLAPDLKRLNPASRLREVLRQNTWALAKALVMLPLAALAVWAIARENLGLYLAMPLGGVETSARQLAGSLMGLMWKAAGLFLALGLVDFARERRRYSRDLRMSRQELREEIKELEGNPQIKARIRRMQRELARRQMMREVPQATAVIVNPTHYAVAVRYQFESMAAPLVVAKGRGLLARRIRQIALAHQVPIVENPPLAQALYKTVKVGQEIPVQMYRAVAEILAYIYRLTHGRFQPPAGRREA
ncbi:MAG: EscU/YscU/HrcU family type III secretion system export apparatus switch protein [Bryobacterales bacterium]|nr:EscU/YscU/HrcU family type III secretion system export apparatus switch protein [Bryobacterales bacterium]